MGQAIEEILARTQLFINKKPSFSIASELQPFFSFLSPLPSQLEKILDYFAAVSDLGNNTVAIEFSFRLEDIGVELLNDSNKEVYSVFVAVTLGKDFFNFLSNRSFKGPDWSLKTKYRKELFQIHRKSSPSNCSLVTQDEFIKELSKELHRISHKFRLPETIQLQRLSFVAEDVTRKDWHKLLDLDFDDGSISQIFYQKLC